MLFLVRSLTIAKPAICPSIMAVVVSSSIPAASPAINMSSRCSHVLVSERDITSSSWTCFISQPAWAASSIDGKSPLRCRSCQRQVPSPFPEIGLHLSSSLEMTAPSRTLSNCSQNCMLQQNWNSHSSHLVSSVNGNLLCDLKPQVSL